MPWIDLRVGQQGSGTVADELVLVLAQVVTAHQTWLAEEEVLEQHGRVYRSQLDNVTTYAYTVRVVTAMAQFDTAEARKELAAAIRYDPTIVGLVTDRKGVLEVLVDYIERTSVG
jgi:hypothetical protein